MLSDKQNAALAKIAQKYQAQLQNKELVSAVLSMNFADQQPAEQSDNTEEIKKMLEKLSGVTTWEPPVKKGRYTIDDKKFCDSLNKQFNDKGRLSEKQIAALKKLAEKYGK